MDAICLCSDVLGIRGDSTGLKFFKDDPASRSLTRQSFAKDADINNIMAKYAVTGVLVDPSNVDSERVARFGDFSDLPDYANLVSRVNQAQEDFMTLPAPVRARFDNDVSNLLDFIAQPENVVEAVGLKVLPESMIDATFMLRPDLVTKEWLAAKAAKEAGDKPALLPAGEGSPTK